MSLVLWLYFTIGAGAGVMVVHNSKAQKWGTFTVIVVMALAMVFWPMLIGARLADEKYGGLSDGLSISKRTRVK